MPLEYTVLTVKSHKESEVERKTLYMKTSAEKTLTLIQFFCFQELTCTTLPGEKEAVKKKESRWILMHSPNKNRILENLVCVPYHQLLCCSCVTNLCDDVQKVIFCECKNILV